MSELDPIAIVLGIPISMDGSEGEMAREARAFGTALSAATGIAVIEWDERLTTALAERALRPEPKRTRRDRSKGGGGRDRGRADRIAAAVILDGYMRRVATDETR